jgi:hypothetical protein
MIEITSADRNEEARHRVLTTRHREAKSSIGSQAAPSARMTGRHEPANELRDHPRRKLGELEPGWEVRSAAGS